MALATMPLFAASRTKKDFYGLAPKTGLTALMVILLKFLGIHLTTAAALAAILSVVCLKIPTEYYGQEPKMDCINTMPSQKALAC